MFRLRLFFLFVLFSNLSALVLSCDLTRLFSVGFSLGFTMCMQLFVGICLSWMYCNVFFFSWFSVLLMVDFEAGYLLRSLHIVLTSCLYFLVYLHICKCIFLFLMFDSALYVWLVGFVLYFGLILIAFIGYVLPLTQMSYWGLTVFSNIFATVPWIGLSLVYWIWGSEFIQEGTLVKIHSLHLILPLILVFLIGLHFFCLHYFLSSDFMDRFVFYVERLFFVYWFYFSDLVLFVLLVFLYFYFVFIYWYFVFHEESWIIVDVMKTSEKVIPEWFFLMFFGVIKSIPDKFFGVLFLFGLFVFMILLVLFFVYSLLYLRLHFLCVFFCFLLVFVYSLLSILSVYVLLLFPIWLWLQLLVVFLLLVVVIRFV